MPGSPSSGLQVISSSGSPRVVECEPTGSSSLVTMMIDVAQGDGPEVTISSYTLFGDVRITDQPI